MNPLGKTISTALTGLTDQRIPNTGCPSTRLDPRWRAKWLRLDESHPEVREMCEKTQRWAAGCLRNDRTGRLLVLAGRTGVGKTAVAKRAIAAISRIAPQAWAMGLSGHRGACVRATWFSWSDLAGLAPWQRNDSTEWPEVIGTTAVMLDDVGAETDQYRSGAPAANLGRILDARAGLWTIVTTNISPDHWAKQWDSRVESRLYEHAVHVVMKTAPDWRKNS